MRYSMYCDLAQPRLPNAEFASALIDRIPFPMAFAERMCLNAVYFNRSFSTRVSVDSIKIAPTPTHLVTREQCKHRLAYGPTHELLPFEKRERADINCRPVV